MSDSEWTDVLDPTDFKDGDSFLFKFTKIGLSIEGIFEGLKPGKYKSPLGVLRSGGKPITFATSTDLTKKLEEVTPGEYIKITFESEKALPEGKRFKKFRVQRRLP